MLRFIGFYNYTVILTYLSLFCSVLGMVQSAKGSYTAAVLCLIGSGLCDAFDGTVARTKKNRTEEESVFGIQIDSLCDVISFGVFPAFLCYHMGADGLWGLLCIFLYCLCAVIRLAFFNVLEEKRQKTETSSNKFYRGLPVTSISIIFPIFYGFRYLLPEVAFVVLLHILLLTVAFLFVLDFSIKKLDVQKILTGKH